MTKQEAIDAIDEMMADHKFGNAGARLVLEEYMEGEEKNEKINHELVDFIRMHIYQKK